MDPTKSFDHLDPKLKDTYARVMGTTTNNASAPAAPLDPALSATPPVTDPAQFSSDLSQAPTTMPDTNGVPNQSTGPAVSSIPTDASAVTPPADMSASIQSLPDTSSPPNTSFFSNPTPAATDPSQMPAQETMNAPIEPPIEPAAPVTPYSPEDFSNQNAATIPQPLPSPASVNQAAPHETSVLLRVVYIVLAAIFFAVYTLFWIKIFGLPIPFFPS